MTARARRAVVLGALAALAAGACHGPAVGEVPPEGGAGAGGRGGAGGGGRGGAAGTSAGGASGTTGASGATGSGGASAGNGGSAGRGGTTGASGATGSGGANAGNGGSPGRGGTTGASGASGGAGSGGRGGGAGSGGRGGAGGAGGGACAPQFQPQIFYTGDYGPYISDGTSTRYYWVEQGTPYVTVHYASAPSPMEITHPYKFDPTGTFPNWDVAFGEGLLAALRLPTGEPHIEGWGPNVGDSKLPDVLDSLDRMEVAVEGSEAYVSRDDPAFAGIYRWNGQGEDTLFASYADLGVTPSQILILRITPKYLVLGGLQDAWVIDRSATTKTLQHVFHSSANIIDVITSRPHSTTAGVLFRTQDGSYAYTGHDYYLDLTASTLGPPRDLPAVINAQTASGACPRFGYDEGGVLYGNRYIYDSTSGLVAVTLASDGTPSQPVLLTDMELLYPEVTGGGDLYASWQPNFKWDYYFVGSL